MATEWPFVMFPLSLLSSIAFYQSNILFILLSMSTPPPVTPASSVHLLCYSMHFVYVSSSVRMRVCFCETAGFKKQHWLISGCVISSFSAHNSHLNYNEQVNLCSCACPKLVQLKSRVTRLGSFWFQAEVQHRKTSYHQIFFNFFFLFGGGALYSTQCYYFLQSLTLLCIVKFSIIIFFFF